MTAQQAEKKVVAPFNLSLVDLHLYQEINALYSSHTYALLHFI